MTILNYLLIFSFIGLGGTASFDLAGAEEPTSDVPPKKIHYVFNAVLVDPTSTVDSAASGVRPFYISIFEASCRDKRFVLGEDVNCFKRFFSDTPNSDPSFAPFPNENTDLDYPAYFSNGENGNQSKPNEAQSFCKLQGGRLPTPQEWTFAALNLYQNQNATNYSDRLLDYRGVPTSNFDGKVERRSNETTMKLLVPGLDIVTRFKTLGIDAIGTVGMTGNIAELAVANVATQNQPVGFRDFSCGFDYTAQRDQVSQSIKSGQICQQNGWNYLGVRCVFDISSENTIQIFDSQKIQGNLRNYIEKRHALVKTKILNGENNGSTHGFFPGFFIDMGGKSPQEIEMLLPSSRPPELENLLSEKIKNYQHPPPAPSQQSREDADAFTIKSSDPSSSDVEQPAEERLAPPQGYGK